MVEIYQVINKNEVEILLYDISKGMAAKLGPLLLGKGAEASLFVIGIE